MFPYSQHNYKGVEQPPLFECWLSDYVDALLKVFFHVLVCRCDVALQESLF